MSPFGFFVLHVRVVVVRDDYGVVVVGSFDDESIVVGHDEMTVEESRRREYDVAAVGELLEDLEIGLAQSHATKARHKRSDFGVSTR